MFKYGLNKQQISLIMATSCIDGQAGIVAQIDTDIKSDGQHTTAFIDSKDLRQKMRFIGLQGKPELVRDFYDEISNQDYDEYCKQFGKEGGARNFAGIVHNVQQDKTARILDVACGSGIVGGQLKQLGFTNIDGLDLSQGMLDLCESKCNYNKLICAGIEPEKKIPEVADGSYDVVCMSGAMATGYVTPDSIHALARMVKPGGSIVFNITLYWLTNVKEFKEDAVGAKLQSFVESGMLTKWSKSKHVSFAAIGEEADFYTLTVA